MRLARGWVVPLAILALWELASRFGLVDAHLVPAPTTVLTSGWHLLAGGLLIEHLGVSAGRVLLGAGIGIVAGTLVGAWVGLSRSTEAYLDPLMQMLRTVPALALVPLFVLWLGIGETSKVTLLAFSTFFPSYINTLAGTRNVDRRLVEVGRTYGLSRREILREIILPGSLPLVLVGVRYGFQVGWLVLIVAEMMGSDKGIGYMIVEAQQFMRTDRVMLGILVFALIGKLVDSLLRALEDRLLAWREAFAGE